MEELELLKKDWNKESENFKHYSEKEIYVMIKKKSVSVVKTLFVIGLIEILLWSVYGYIDGELPYLRMVLFSVFIVLTAVLFQRMKVSQSSLSLMKNILYIRKLIFGYAGISFFMIILDNLFHFKYYTRDFMAGLNDGYKHNNPHTTNSEQMIPELGNYMVFGVVLMIMIYLLYIIYQKTYGKILFNLKKNYKELSRVEES